jgi:hypothetical protein
VKTTAPALRWWLLARGARYTRNVSWRHRISLGLLMVLIALPVSGSMCAMLCDSVATHEAGHHRSGKPCHDQPPHFSDPQLRGASGHDCGHHDAAMRLAATTTATRADNVTGPSLVAPGPAHDSISKLIGSNAVLDYRTPPGSPPPTASPLVLRV